MCVGTTTEAFENPKPLSVSQVAVCVVNVDRTAARRRDRNWLRHQEQFVNRIALHVHAAVYLLPARARRYRPDLCRQIVEFHASIVESTAIPLMNRKPMPLKVLKVPAVRSATSNTEKQRKHPSPPPSIAGSFIKLHRFCAKELSGADSGGSHR